jgi:hypothetical protein
MVMPMIVTVVIPVFVATSMSVGMAVPVLGRGVRMPGSGAVVLALPGHGACCVDIS